MRGFQLQIVVVVALSLAGCQSDQPASIEDVHDKLSTGMTVGNVTTLMNVQPELIHDGADGNPMVMRWQIRDNALKADINKDENGVLCIGLRNWEELYDPSTPDRKPPHYATTTTEAELPEVVRLAFRQRYPNEKAHLVMKGIEYGKVTYYLIHCGFEGDSPGHVYLNPNGTFYGEEK